MIRVKSKIPTLSRDGLFMPKGFLGWITHQAKKKLDRDVFIPVYWDYMRTKNAWEPLPFKTQNIELFKSEIKSTKHQNQIT